MSAWMLATLLAAALIAGAALAAEEVARLMRRPRRWGWVAAMVATASIPLLFRLFPVRIGNGAPPASSDPEMLAALLAGASQSEPGDGLLAALRNPAADPYLSAIWIGMTALVSGSLLYTWLRLRRVRAHADPVEIAGIPALLTRVMGPMVVGVRRPAVVVPRWITTLSDDELRLVVRHEWEHVRAGDTRLLLFSALLIAAMPWNLPLWWMRRRLRQAMEVDCDARVLASGADRRLYGQMLIQTAGRPVPAPLLAPALVEPPSLLERRIVAMTTKRPAHPRLRAAAAGILGVSLFIAACELSPRSTSLSPTEPTLADVASSEATDVVQVRKMGGDEAEVLHAVVTENGDTVWGAPVRIRMSLNNENLEAMGEKALFIVDGVPAEGMEGIDPGRIMQIEVVKGDEALREFGARGANGVVKVTTGELVTYPRVPGEAAPSKEVGTVTPREPNVTSVRVAPAAPARTPRGARPMPVEPAGLDPTSPEGAAAAARAPENVRTRSVPAPGRTVEGADRLEGVVAVGYGTAPRTATAPQPVRAAEGEPVAAVGYGTTLRSARPVRAEDAALAPGAPVELRVRADAITMVRAPEPLILVDGETVPSLAEFERRYAPGQIESIQVLKDASATALYGERGRNGVILIELKK